MSGQQCKLLGMVLGYSAGILTGKQNIRTRDNKIVQLGQGDIAMLAGAGAGVEIITDRAEAIRHAILAAAADDVIVIAGKGHEPYQEINGIRHPFSDVEQTRAALETWNDAQGELS